MKPKYKPKYWSWSPRRGAPLSPRELEVLQLIARGESTQAVALQLGISAATVSHHMTHIHQKLGARNRTEAVVKAIRTGLIQADPS